MFDFCMPHLLYGHGDIPKKPSDVIMFVKGRVAKTFQEAVLEKGGGRALEHPRGLPFAPAVANACRGECLQSWALGTSEVVVRVCWRTEWETFIPAPRSSQFAFLSVCLKKAYSLAGDGVCAEGIVGVNQE